MEHKSDSLFELSVRGLESMFDFENHLFCYKRREMNGRLVNEGLSFRYTVISLLGLWRFEGQGGKTRIDIGATTERLREKLPLVDNIGDLGLFLWLYALVRPDGLPDIYGKLGLTDILSRFEDARKGKTMELSWFLTALSYGAPLLSGAAGGLQDLSLQVFALLSRNYGGKGIFGHLSKKSFVGMIRGRIGSFADQVYPIYALSRFAQKTGNKEALRIAVECGKKICDLQGPLGQWWWHYDAVSGRVLGRYPVYSVHQDGMAPMALCALGEASGIDFGSWVGRGLSWISGVNELKRNLVDFSQDMIWRSIYQERRTMYMNEILSFLRCGGGGAPDSGFLLLSECRPYHLGWLLYALCGRHDGHVVPVGG